MTQPKKMIVRDLTVTEVSSVDIPAVKGAVAVMLKSGTSIRKNAADVAAGAAEPLYKAAEYGDAMMERAGEIAAQTGTSPAKAFLDHSGSDPVLIELAYGERAAEFAVRKARSAQHFEKVGRWPSIPQRGHLLPKGRSETRNCLLCTKSFATDIADRRMCERCEP